MQMTRKECLEAVQGPGKFGGEAVYVPYFWYCYLNGFADSDDGIILRFDVSKDDRKLFPELRQRRSVSLRETGDGFVIEV